MPVHLPSKLMGFTDYVNLINGDENVTPKEKVKKVQKPVTMDDFNIIKVLGRGAFGKVMLV